MTAAVRPVIDSAALAPVCATMRGAFGTGRLPGLAPGLLVNDPVGWLPATALTNGSRLPDLLDAATRRWQAAPHAAAALAWKAYSYWLALPAVLGWASARRVPLMHPGDVLVHLADHRPLLTLGLRRTVRIAVLPNDPLALASAPATGTARFTGASCPPDGSGRPPDGSGRPPDGSGRPPDGPGIVVVRDEAALLGALRASLLDHHLNPLLEQVRHRVRLGSRTLLGSLASGVAYGVIHAADALPGSTVANVGALLDALDVADLVDLVPGPGGELAVQRKTCCLAFTLPEPKICTGCCIRAA